MIDRVLALRTCDGQSRSFGGFLWPQAGRVASPTWHPEPNSPGHGLTAWPWGMLGAQDYVAQPPDARWLVLEFPDEPVVSSADKVKFPAAEVLFNGSRPEALRFFYRQWAMDTVAGADFKPCWQSSAGDWVFDEPGRRCHGAGHRGVGFQDQSRLSADGEACELWVAGHQAMAWGLGWGATVLATGDQGRAVASQDASVAVSLGQESRCISLGRASVSLASGFQSHAVALGERSVAINVGVAGVALTESSDSPAVCIGAEASSLAMGPKSMAVGLGDACKVECGPGGVAAAFAPGAWLRGGEASLLVGLWDDPLTGSREVLTGRVGAGVLQINQWYRVEKGQWQAC